MHQLVNPYCYVAPTMAVSNSVQSRLNFEQRANSRVATNQDAQGVSHPRESDNHADEYREG